jgi:uncharacterized protein
MRERDQHRVPSSLAGRVVRFADFLKGHGFRVFQSSVHDALRSLEQIELERSEDFLAALRVNLSSSDLEWTRFEGLFEAFWNLCGVKSEEPGNEPGTREKDSRYPSRDVRFLPSDDGEPAGTVEVQENREWLEGVAYSPVSMVEKKDLGRFDNADVLLAQLALKKMMEPFRVNIIRRSRRSRRRGNMDFPRIMRRSLKTEGTPLELFYREKKRRLKRLVILADVSGSMDRYARFVMPFLLGLRGIGSRAEVFVFSTSLTSITFTIRHLSMEKALDRISQEVPDWSGGTRIGLSLHQFNQGQGRRLLSRRSVVVILSDGWDLGGKELLRREMEVLSRRAHCVVWLNPLAGDPEYQPMCKGMQVALPYVDHFMAADSLMSLKRVGRLLSRVMIH